jgi:tRNA pseudouridine55 synthase
VKFEYPDFELEIRCGSGTYVRAIGRDIGLRLGSSAVLTALERTAIGQFSIEHAIVPEQLTAEAIQRLLIEPAEAVADLPMVSLSEAQVELLRDGWMLPIDSLRLALRDGQPRCNSQIDMRHNELAALDQQGQLIAILCRRPGDQFSPKINFAHYYCSDNQRSPCCPPAATRPSTPISPPR